MNPDGNEFGTLDEARAEIERLRRALKRHERDVRVLNRINETNEKIRREHERGEKLQSLFNRLLLANTPNMLFLFNRDLEYVLGSRVGDRLTRQEHRALLNRPLPMVFAKEVDGAWVEKITAMSAEAARNRTAARFNDTIRVDGEEDIEAKISISPIVDEEDVCHGTILSITDVTELVAARRAAEEAARSKGAFLANMSHEIRTPMNAIKGLSELLALTPLTPTQKNYVTTVISSANSLIGVINDVLDFSKIEANRIEISPADYSVHKLLSELCGVLGLRAEAKGLALVLETDPDIPSRLIGDDARIKQILLNLLSNAIKYTPSGKVTFRMSVGARADGDADADGIELRCQVEDTGVGIRAEDRDSLFTAFSRFDVRANRAIQGTGLGLAISKRLAEAMGGDIGIASEYGRGSVFTLRLPQKVADATPLAGLDDPAEVRALLLVTGERAANLETMLHRLGARFAHLDDSGTDIGLAKRLAEPGHSLPARGEEEFTHCIYSEIVPERDVAALRERLPRCRFAALRSIINSVGEDGSGRKDAVLFNPLLVTELAKFLNKSGARTQLSPAPKPSASVRLATRDVAALVVDDNRINLMVCEKMLQVHGVEVATASGGKEAVAMCAERKFDILFVDHMMPEMDGIEVTGEIRSKPGPNRKTPIIALTANVVNDMRNYYIKCGMDDFVAKPIDRNELARVLRQWVPAGKVFTVSETRAEPGA